MNLRDAKESDALEIANIHTYSWLEAYQGVVPTQFLTERPLHLKERVRHWERTLRDPEWICQVAEHNELGVVGFISGKSGRDEQYASSIQICYFYLFQKFHGQKIGYRLLKSFFGEAINRGFSQGYVWVFDNSEVTSFYRRSGGKATGERKARQLGNDSITEVCFLWDDLSLGQAGTKNPSSASAS